MKAIVFAALMALPSLAAASLGPSITQTEASAAQVHLVQMAWSAPGDSVTPDCTTHTPAVEAVLYACVVFPIDQ